MIQSQHIDKIFEKKAPVKVNLGKNCVSDSIVEELKEDYDKIMKNDKVDEGCNIKEEKDIQTKVINSFND